MPTSEPLALDLKDYRRRRIIFTKKKLNQKKADHPELGLVEFMRAVKSALERPEEVWPDYYKRGEIDCYYGKYIDGVYAKVVVYVRVKKDEPCRVVSAYAIDYIKEKKYKELKRIA